MPVWKGKQGKWPVAVIHFLGGNCEGSPGQGAPCLSTSATPLLPSEEFVSLPPWLLRSPPSVALGEHGLPGDDTALLASCVWSQCAGLEVVLGISYRDCSGLTHVADNAVPSVMASDLFISTQPVPVASVLFYLLNTFLWLLRFFVHSLSLFLISGQSPETAD